MTFDHIESDIQSILNGLSQTLRMTYSPKEPQTQRRLVFTLDEGCAGEVVLNTVKSVPGNRIASNRTAPLDVSVTDSMGT